jgi:hypothetical protein
MGITRSLHVFQSAYLGNNFRISAPVALPAYLVT